MGLARERRLVGLEAGGLDDPTVGGEAPPASRTTTSPGTSSAAATCWLTPPRTTWATATICFFRAASASLGLPLGQEADDGVQDDHDQDGDALDDLAGREGDGAAATRRKTIRLRNCATGSRAAIARDSRRGVRAE